MHQAWILPPGSGFTEKFRNIYIYICMESLILPLLQTVIGWGQYPTSSCVGHCWKVHGQALAFQVGQPNVQLVVPLLRSDPKP